MPEKEDWPTYTTKKGAVKPQLVKNCWVGRGTANLETEIINAILLTLKACFDQLVDNKNPPAYKDIPAVIEAIRKKVVNERPESNLAAGGWQLSKLIYDAYHNWTRKWVAKNKANNGEVKPKTKARKKAAVSRECLNLV